jgi:hypothetical protein
MVETVALGALDLSLRVRKSPSLVKNLWNDLNPPISPRQLTDSSGVAPGTKGCYTLPVPTARPRHFVTETDELAAALDEAAQRWPDLSRAQLLARLAIEGHHAAERAEAVRRQRRRAAIRRYSGMLTGVYGPAYLDALHEDWPA